MLWSGNPLVHIPWDTKIRDGGQAPRVSEPLSKTNKQKIQERPSDEVLRGCSKGWVWDVGRRTDPKTVTWKEAEKLQEQEGREEEPEEVSGEDKHSKPRVKCKKLSNTFLLSHLRRRKNVHVFLFWWYKNDVKCFRKPKWNDFINCWDAKITFSSRIWDTVCLF